MSFSRRAAAASVVAVQSLLACSDASVDPLSHASPLRPAADLVATTVDRVITAEEFALADLDKNGAACSKTTPSTHLLLKDANEATPSQPCPAGWASLFGAKTITVPDAWYDDDKNGNGQVCVKFVGPDGKAIVKDDNAATPSQPCPPAFSPAAKSKTPKADESDVLLADDDGDKMVCVNALPSGNFIARDDNNATPSQPCPPAWAVVIATTGGGDPATGAGDGK